MSVGEPRVYAAGGGDGAYAAAVEAAHVGHEVGLVASTVQEILTPRRDGPTRPGDRVTAESVRRYQRAGPASWCMST